MIDANLLGALGTLVSDSISKQMADKSASAAAVLSMLHFKPGLTGTQLAAILSITQPTMVRVVNGLEAEGLVMRGTVSGKTTPLYLTDAGQQAAGAFQTKRLQGLDDLLSPLSASERETFQALAARIVESATTSRAFAKTTCRFCEHQLCGPDICPIGCAANRLESAPEGDLA